MSVYAPKPGQHHQLETRIIAAQNELARYSGVTVDTTKKAKALRKFGRRAAVSTTRVTVWNGDDGNETLPSTNAITVLSSSSASDDANVTITVEGHTISAGALTFVTQTRTLNGQTDVTLDTALARCTRMYVSSTTQPAVGNIYAHEGTTTSAGKPTDTSKIHAVISAGEQQTEKAATAISSTDYWFVLEMQGYITGSQNAKAEFRMEYKAATGSVWLPTGAILATDSDGSTSYLSQLYPAVTIPANSDVRITAIASASCDVAAYMGGYLGQIV